MRRAVGCCWHTGTNNRFPVWPSLVYRWSLFCMRSSASQIVDVTDGEEAVATPSLSCAVVPALRRCQFKGQSSILTVLCFWCVCCSGVGLARAVRLLAAVPADGARPVLDRWLGLSAGQSWLSFCFVHDWLLSRAVSCAWPACSRIAACHRIPTPCLPRSTCSSLPRLTTTSCGSRLIAWCAWQAYDAANPTTSWTTIFMGPTTSAPG